MVEKWKKPLNLLGKMEGESIMGKWNNLRNTEAGRYKLSTMVVSALLIVSLLWQGVFAMLGTTDVNADAFAMMEAFSELSHDGLHEQRQAAWIYAVRNPAAEGGVWGQFWGTAQFGAAGSDAVPQFPNNLPNPGLTSTFTDTQGIVWRVIAAEGNSRLIMTEHVHMQGVQYNIHNLYARLSQSNLRGALDDWGAENLASELAERARVPNNVDNDLRSDWDTTNPAWSATENGAAGWTSPGAAAVNANEALFVLSISEVNRYAAAVGTTSEERIARNAAGAANHWWLRSPGDGLFSVSVLDFRGTVFNAMADSSVMNFGARPALWINL